METRDPDRASAEAVRDRASHGPAEERENRAGDPDSAEDVVDEDRDQKRSPPAPRQHCDRKRQEGGLLRALAQQKTQPGPRSRRRWIRRWPAVAHPASLPTRRPRPPTP